MGCDQEFYPKNIIFSSTVVKPSKSLKGSKKVLQSASLIEYLDLHLKKETSIILYHIYQVENGTHLFSFGNNITQNVMRGWRISHDIKCDMGARHKTREASLLDLK